MNPGYTQFSAFLVELFVSPNRCCDWAQSSLSRLEHQRTKRSPPRVCLTKLDYGPDTTNETACSFKIVAVKTIKYDRNTSCSMRTATAAMITFLITVILIAGCTKGNITGYNVQKADGPLDNSLGSGPDNTAAQNAQATDIGNTAGSNQSGADCSMGEQTLNSIFSGRGSL